MARIYRSLQQPHAFQVSHDALHGLSCHEGRIGGTEAGRSYGSHDYTALAQTTPDGDHQWDALGSLDGSPAPDVPELRKRLAIPPAFLAQVRDVVTPGTTLIITDKPLD